MKNDKLLTLIESIANKIMTTKALLNLIPNHPLCDALNGIILILESCLEDMEQLFVTARGEFSN